MDDDHDTPRVPEVYAGSDPIDWEAIPFEVTEQLTQLMGTIETDVWGDWYLSSGLLDVAAVEAGGPDGLDAIWAGVLRAVDAGWFVPCTREEMVAAGRVPLWCRTRPGYEPYFGVLGCCVAAGVIALGSRWMVRELGTTWVLPEDVASLDRSEPCLSTPGGWRGILPTVQFVGSIGGASGLRSSEPERNPFRLRELIYLHAPDADDPLSDDLEGPIVDGTGQPDHWMIGFSDLQGNDEDERVEAFAALLDASPGITRAYREDRELVCADAPLDLAAMQVLAEHLWAAAASHDRPPSV